MRLSAVSLMIILTTLVGAAASAGTVTPALQAQLDAAKPGDLIGAVVQLRDQAPIARLDGELRAEKASRQERHQAVVLALQAAAARAQEPLRRDLADAGRDGDVASFTAYWIANVVVVRATPEALRQIAQRPDVLAVEPNFGVRLVAPVSRGASLDEPGPHRGIGVAPGVRAVRAPEVWYQLGYTGAGRLVGSLDTGVDVGHPALGSRWRGVHRPWQECWLDVLGTNTVVPTDISGHGTHTTGTMTGIAPDDTIGVAWGAEWIAANAIGQLAVPEFADDVLACFQWFADPDGDPGTVDDVPDVVENSWAVDERFPGYVDCDSHWWDAIDNCEAAGVVTVFAAGNEGPATMSVGSPADRATTATNAFAVGAVDAFAYDFPYPVAEFSSRGPSGCDAADTLRVKPELVAPGMRIYSSVPSGGYEDRWLGSSMAGPHVAGAVVLMREADPDLDVATIKTILMQTARDAGDPGEDNAYGWGILDVHAAVSAVISGFGELTGAVGNASHDGSPIPGAVILLSGHGYRFVAGPDGVFHGRAAPGAYTAIASAPGFIPQEVFVEIAAGEATVADFSLVDDAGPRIANLSAPLAIAAADGPVTITATIADASAVAAATLWWRAGTAAWEMTPMTAAGADTFAATLPEFAADTRVDYYVTATDGAGLQSGSPDDLLILRVCDLAFADDAEDPGLPGWQLGVTDDAATAGRWVREDPVGTFDGVLPIQPEDDHTPGPGVACFLTGNCPPGSTMWVNRVTGGCTTLVSPAFDLSGCGLAFVEYHRWYAKANNYDDELAIDVSPDDGVSWLPLERIVSSRPAWTRHIVELSTLAPLGPAWRLRVRACNTGLQGIVEAALDDIRVLVIRDALTPVSDDPVAPPRFALQPPRPNPFNPSTRLAFSLVAAGPARLRVHDLAGRLVRTLVDEPLLAAGAHVATWDGRDEAGRTVAAGIYVGTLEAGGDRASQRMLLVK